MIGELTNITHTLVATPDLNSCIYTGVYKFDGYTSNTPTNNMYGVCATFSTNTTVVSNSWYFQVAFDTLSNNKFYFRKKINASDWTSWVQSFGITQVTKTMTTNANGYIPGAGNGFTPYNLLDACIINHTGNRTVLKYTYNANAYLIPTEPGSLSTRYANTAYTYVLTLVNL